MSDQPSVERADIVEREHGGQFVQLVADLCRPQARRQNAEQARPAVGGQGAQGLRQAMTDGPGQ